MTKIFDKTVITTSIVSADGVLSSSEGKARTRKVVLNRGNHKLPATAREEHGRERLYEPRQVTLTYVVDPFYGTWFCKEVTIDGAVFKNDGTVGRRHQREEFRFGTWPEWLAGEVKEFDPAKGEHAFAAVEREGVAQ